MSKFHVKANGDMGRCTAKEGACPFSSEGAEHFDSFQNAAVYAEAVVSRQEGGSFATATHSRAVSYETFEVDAADPANYTDGWSVSGYMGEYIERGGKFLYDDKIYVADDWEWNRAALATYIQATDTETGEKVELTIPQGSEDDVAFIDKKAITLRDGRNVNIIELEDELHQDYQAAEEVVNHFMEAEDSEDEHFTSPGGRDFYVNSRRIEWGGNDFYAVRIGDVPLEAEDDSRDTLRNMKFFKDEHAARDEIDRVQELASFS